MSSTQTARPAIHDRRAESYDILFPETARPITAAILETCHSPVACSKPQLPFPVKHFAMISTTV